MNETNLDYSKLSRKKIKEYLLPQIGTKINDYFVVIYVNINKYIFTAESINDCILPNIGDILNINNNAYEVLFVDNKRKCFNAFFKGSSIRSDQFDENFQLNDDDNLVKMI